MTKILLIHQIFVTPDTPGGTRHYELAKYLVKKGHQVCIIACRINYLTGEDRKKSFEIIDGIEVFYCNAYKSLHKNIFSRALSFLSFSLSSFLKALTVKKIDVVWGTSPPIFQAFTALLVAKIRRKKFYYEVRDLWIDFAQELGVIKNRAVIFSAKSIEKTLYYFSDHIIINSPGFLPHIEKIAKQKISIIPNGVITRDFNVISENAFFIHNRVKHSFLAIYIGNLGIANDIETILDAASNLEEHKNIGIVLMGGGIRFSELKEKIQHMKNVYIFPSQKKSLIPYILSEANIGIATLKNISLFNTTYPNKVFDYMAAKKPTVLAIDGVIREVIEQSKGGIFVSPGDHQKLAETILHYYQNPHIVIEHGNNALDYVKKHFEREKIAEDLNLLFP